MPEEPPNPTLWDNNWPPTTGPDENSRAAAASVISVVGSRRRLAAEYIASHGPVAEWEVGEALGLIRPASTPIIYELHRAGVIERHERKGTTPSGRACWRYVITPFWKSYLEADED